MSPQGAFRLGFNPAARRWCAAAHEGWHAAQRNLRIKHATELAETRLMTEPTPEQAWVLRASAHGYAAAYQTPPVRRPGNGRHRALEQAVPASAARHPDADRPPAAVDVPHVPVPVSARQSTRHPPAAIPAAVDDGSHDDARPLTASHASPRLCTASELHGSPT